MDIEPEIAVSELFDRDGIIQVFGILTVYRYGKKISLVTSSLRDLIYDKFRGRIYRQRFNFLKNTFRECLGKTELP